MARISIGFGTRFLFDEKCFEIVNELEEDNFNCKNVASGRNKVYSRWFLLEKMNSGELTFSLVGGKNTTGEVMIKNIKPDLMNVSDKQKDIANFRLFAITPLLGLDDVKSLQPYYEERKNELMEEGYHHKGYNFSGYSIYRWLKNYKESDGNIWSLISIYEKCGRKKKSLHTEVEAIIQQKIDYYLKRREIINSKDVYDLTYYQVEKDNQFREAKNQLLMPSKSTVYRRCRFNDEEELSRNRKGGRYAYEKYRQIQLQKKPERPLQRVEIDHTKLDLCLIDFERGIPLGRPTVTTLFDCYTGYQLGMYIGYESAGSTAVLYALKHAISPKNYVKELFPSVVNEWHAYGLPELIVTDRGKEFLGSHFKDACMMLGIKTEACPGRSPWYKGQIERHFRTVNQGLIHKIPGTTFSNIFMKGDYDPAKNAIMDINVFLELFHIWLLDYYSCDINTGVNGIPKVLWQHGIKIYGEPEVPASKFDWDIAVMKVGTGTIQTTGIRTDFLHYQSHELHGLRRKLQTNGKKNEIKFKYDPSDLGKMHVYDPVDNVYIEALCTNQKYASGLNEYAHRVNRDNITESFKTVNQSELSAAKEMMMRKIDEAGKFIGNKKVNVARYKGVGSNAILIDGQQNEAPIVRESEADSVYEIVSEIEDFNPDAYSSNWRVKDAGRI